MSPSETMRSDHATVTPRISIPKVAARSRCLLWEPIVGRTFLFALGSNLGLPATMPDDAKRADGHQHQNARLGNDVELVERAAIEQQDVVARVERAKRDAGDTVGVLEV